jgi:hypothetical protein
VKLIEGKKTIGCKWVFRVKQNVDGEIDHYKAQLVAKGYSQVVGLITRKLLHLLQDIHQSRCCWE